jgi:RNA polymerase sigma-70 factor (ECF subfamily)
MRSTANLRVVDLPPTVAAAADPVPRRRLGSALDEKEFTQVYRRFWSPVLKRCRSIMRDRHAAEDAAQTVFTKLWRYGDSFREAECQLAWLRRVADRCCFDELRRRRPHCPEDLTIEMSPDATRAVDAVEHRDLARRFLHRLDERVKQVAVMRYCEEMNQNEIAQETNWSRQTVFKKLAFVHQRAHALRASLYDERGRK